MGNPAFKYTDWKVFLDGVEVPHLGFSASFSVGSPGVCMINMEPDPVLAQLRGQTMVHIFCRRHDAESGSKPEDAYVLFWEGFTTGTDHSKDPSNRMFTLRCVGILHILQQFKAYSVGVGILPVTSILTGSGELPVLVSGSALSAGPQTGNVQALIAMRDKMNNNEIPYSQRVVNVIRTSGSYNSLLRQHLLRLRLFDKVFGIPDSVVGDLLNKELVKNQVNSIASSITQNSSVMDLMNYYLRLAYYEYSHVPFPAKGDEDLLTKNKSAMGSSENLRLKYPTSTPRLDYVLHGLLQSMLPPPCNFIFPDQITSLSVSRDRLVEPTRYLVVNPALKLLNVNTPGYFAPVGIVQERQAHSSAQIYGYSENFTPGSGQSADDIYRFNKDDAAINLLKTFTTEEYERGINSYLNTLEGEELFMALATNGQVDRLVREEANEDQDPNKNVHKQMIDVTNYMFELSRFKGITASVSLSGHRWIVPGFPAVIMDRDVSYQANVNSVSFSVSVTGLETTTLSCSYARPMSYGIGFVEIKQLADTASEAIKAANDAVEQAKASVTVDDVKAAADDFFQDIIQFVKKSIEILKSKEIAALLEMGDDFLAANVLRTDGINPEETREFLKSSPLGRLILFAKDISTRLRDLRAIYSVVVSKLEGDNNARTDYPNLVGLLAPASDLYRVLEKQLSLESSLANLGDILYDYTKTQITVQPPTRPAASNKKTTSETKPILDRMAEAKKELPKLIDEVVAKGNTGPELQTKDAKSASVITATKAARQQVVTSTNSLIQELTVRYGIPVPPAFMNENLTDLLKLDDFYQKVLGCRPVYSEKRLSVDPFASLRSLIGEAENLQLKRINSLLNYLTGLLIIDKIYPVLGQNIVFRPTLSEWESKSQDPDFDIYDWENSSFLKREATTLGNFLEANDLKIETPYNFMVFKPNSDAAWDNSIFSKLVDDNEMLNLGGSNKEVGEVRQREGDASFLNSKTRQEFISRYSYTHFNKRSFDGT